MAEERQKEGQGRVEGEGSYEATHRYNEAVSRHVASGKTEELAEKAAEALEGPEAEELARAEEKGKRGPSAPKKS